MALPQTNGEWTVRSTSTLDGAFKWPHATSRLRPTLRMKIQTASSSLPGPGRSTGTDSYLNMWKRAKERQEHEQLKLYKEQNQPHENANDGGAQRNEDWEEKSQKFATLLQVPKEERDRVQRMQVVDRASAALAAVNALLNEESSFRNSAATLPPSYARAVSEFREKPAMSTTSNSTGTSSPTLGSRATPGPDFWAWSPPPIDEDSRQGSTERLTSKAAVNKPVVVLEKEPTAAFLDMPLERMQNESFSSIFQSRAKPSLPPLQSLLEVREETATSLETGVQEESVTVPDIAEEIAPFIEQKNANQTESHGVDANGSPWWKETGTELREDGITCSWTVIRGINADGTEWEEKFWEAFDDLDYKELGAEKSGRDAYGNVWREFWKEAMWQDVSSGLMHIEKSADKWAKNGYGGEWHEKWWEHYDASGRAEKWADKWCKIDPNTPLEAGHAHVWHERWGEKFDGQGEAMKYTDKWAERSEYGGGWSKWGDKWDENFNKYGHGIKQGETWWEGQHGERWNRTWGEGHNGTGWVHKYGQSSSGEHWDTHEPQDTWYERFPHFGFHHCVENSKQLSQVGKPKK